MTAMKICTSYENVVVVESNSTRPLDDFFYCLGRLYDFLVVLDERTTMNMDPWVTRTRTNAKS